MVCLINIEAGSSKHMDHFSMIKVIIKKKKIVIMSLVFWDGCKKTLSQTESNNRKSMPLFSFAI